MTVAECLRLIGSVNTKPARASARCRIVHLDDRRYCLDAFRLSPLTRGRVTAPTTLSGSVIEQFAGAFERDGFTRRGDWLNGPCPNAARHKHGDRHPSFGFNTRTGYGFCYVCGSMLLKELYALLAIPFKVELKPRRMNR